MRQILAKAALALLAPRGKSAAGNTPAVFNSSTYDSYQRRRQPTDRELLRELRNTAYACASLNAATCAESPPSLYVVTRANEARPKCPTKALPRHRAQELATRHKALLVEEVTEHPLLTLLNRANSLMSGYDLWELTTLYQEIHGLAYWLLDFDLLDTPAAIWPLPTHLMTPHRAKGSPHVVDYYAYLAADGLRRIPAAQVIPFRYPDPRDPYRGGLSPLRATIENVALEGEYLATRTAVVRNSGHPSVVISPKDAISPAEVDRLEQDWRRKFTRGGQGNALVSDSPMDVKLLERSLGDLAALAEQAQSKEAIMNAFGIPVSFFTKETNLANLEAADGQYARSIRPKFRRRDATMNEFLVPLYDPTGRLFVETNDPHDANRSFLLKQQRLDLDTGVRTINEVRAERGLPPAAWGEEPWLPLRNAPASFDRRQFTIFAPQTGRNKPEQPAEVASNVQ